MKKTGFIQIVCSAKLFKHCFTKTFCNRLFFPQRKINKKIDITLFDDNVLYFSSINYEKFSGF